MVSRQTINEFVDSVVTKFQPKQVILFGSHAYGTPNHDSDVDLLVVMPYRGSSATAAAQIRLACPRGFPMDLIVRSPVEWRDKLAMNDPFVSEVMSKGIVLHDANHARVG